MASATFPITGDPDADQLLVDDPFALLLGMLLDQQVPMEWAFRAPSRLRDRLDGPMTPAALAAMSEADVEALFKEKPALHRFPGSMGKRAHALATAIVDDYGGDTEAIWRGVKTGDDVLGRLKALPGFGDEKSMIFLALLGKRFGVRPTGWREAAGPFGDDEPRSVADIDSREAFDAVRAWKQAKKAAGKTKQD